MKKTLTFLGLVIAVAEPTPASAQRLSWNPVVTTAVAYDTNVLSGLGEGRDDWLGMLIVNVPVGYRPTPRFGVTAGYVNVSERYQTYPELDDWQARSAADVGVTWAPGRRTDLRAGGSYGQTNRPGEIFSEAGLELGRQPTTTYGGSAGLSQGLGAHTNLDLGYTYRYREAATIEDEFHGVDARLGRRFGDRTGLGLSWQYQRVDSEARDVYQAHILMLDWDQELSQHVSFAVSAGTRFSEGRDPRPEGRATLIWSRRRWAVGARYAHSIGYVPRTTDLEGRLGTSDSAGLTVSYRGRHWRLSAGPSYYWTRNSSYDTRVWRALAQVSFMPLDWLGLDATYSYVNQSGIVSLDTDPTNRDSTRHVGRVGVTIAPWNRRGAEGLP